MRRTVVVTVIAVAVLGVPSAWWLQQREFRNEDRRVYEALMEESVLRLRPPGARLVNQTAIGPCKGDSGPGTLLGSGYASNGSPQNALEYFRSKAGGLGWSDVRVTDRLLATKTLMSREILLEVTTDAYLGIAIHVFLRFTPRQWCGYL